MKSASIRRMLVVTPIVIGVLVIAAFVTLQFATRTLKTQVEQALGPESEVREIVVGMSAIELHGIRIAAPKGWPAQDTLRAERVIIRPDLLGLFSARLHVPRIIVENATISALRTQDGKFRLLPSLMEKKGDATGTPSSMPAITLGRIEVRNGVLEFFDASVRQPAHKTRLEQLYAEIDDVRLPALDSRTGIQIDATVKGVQRNGKLMISGWAELGNRNSEIATKLQGVDLVALQPYLIKASETGVRRGTLDMRIMSSVRKSRLHAPGSVTLSGLELASGGSGMGTFMGVPRQAVVAALKNRKGQITINFTLEGNLDDPSFSLNENLVLRVAAAVAETLGISIEGVARGIGGAAEGLGGVMKKLFGK